METNSAKQCSLSWVLAVLTICFILGLSSAGFAQLTTGSIVGTVRDSSGLSLPNATVKLTNTATGLVRTVTTSGSGDYTASLLPIGKYDVEVNATGFKTSNITGTVLDVNQTVRIDCRLQVGEAIQTVEVVDSGLAMLRTDQSDVGQIVDQKEITQIPLNGRDYMQLATLSPGVSRMNRTNSFVSDQKGIIANGASSDSNQYTLDGVQMQSEIDNSATLQPSPDAIAEFKIMTADYTAEYGRAAGAHVNVVTKSGTNAFHGSAFEFIRNQHLDARNYFDAEGNLPQFKQNQFGGTVGGPIRRDKTFFFASYQGFRSYKGLTSSAILPTTAQRAGDLSSGAQIYDPLTTRVDAATGKTVRDPFPNNQIPTNRLSASAQTALKLLYPNPSNQTPNVVNQYLSPQQRVTRDEEIFRGDHQFSATDTIFARYAGNEFDQFLPTLGSIGLPGSESQENESDENAVIGYTKIFSPRLINQAWVGYNRSFIKLYPTLSSCIVCEIGINGVSTDKGSWGPPNISISGMSDVGAFAYAPQFPVSNQFIYNDTLSITTGKHNIKVGADIDRHQMNGIVTNINRGYFVFNGQLSADPEAAAGATGQGLADFLLGYPSLSEANLSRDQGDLRAVNAGFFAQDDWQITRDLTVNIGLRYEWMPLPVSANDRIALWDSRNNAIVLAENNLQKPSIAVGFEGKPIQTLIDSFSGIFNFETRSQAKLPRSLAINRGKDFQPRVGFAWRIPGTSKTVLRGGWGRFYEMVGMNIDLNETANTPYGRSLIFTADPSAVPDFTLSNPFPSTSVQGKPGFSEGKSIFWRDPYQDNFNLAIQREVFQRSSVEVAYVGSSGTGQSMYTNLNGPVFGAGTAQSRLPDTTHGSVNVMEPWGHRWYDSMQVKWETRLTNLSLRASYTYSKLLTEGGGGINEQGTSSRLSYNFYGARTEPTERLSANDKFLSVDKGLAPGDSPSRLSVAYVWQLPVGKNQWLNPKGPVGWFADNWQLSGITTFETGDTTTPALAVDNLNGAGTSRPNVSGNPNHGPKTVNEWFKTSAFSAPKEFATVIADNLDPLLAAGNSRRGIIRGPGYQTWDLSVTRNFPLKDLFNTQFRAEMFNAFNKTNLGDPNVTYGTGTFGQITSTAGTSREIQFGLSITF